MARRPNAHSFGETENDQLIYGLKSKVTTLKSLTLDMGDEIKYQNAFLNDLDKDTDSTFGMLSSNINRIKRLSRSGGCKFYFMLIAFSFFVFFFIWMMFY
ncbi:BET1 homolog [Tetranychus urticae]|uniref:BET1 homolog n=1 Tax=Tetranychus urticae TaxID=32264 RepID=UPI00077BB603|nr:BET1 homolog [Tetranychus urticae]